MTWTASRKNDWSDILCERHLRLRWTLSAHSRGPIAAGKTGHTGYQQERRYADQQDENRRGSPTGPNMREYRYHRKEYRYRTRDSAEAEMLTSAPGWRAVALKGL